MNASAASASDWIIARTCVITRTRWRFQRSSQTPAMGATKNAGIWPDEAGESQKKGGIGELVDDPTRGEPGHPRADERNTLAREE